MHTHTEGPYKYMQSHASVYTYTYAKHTFIYARVSTYRHAENTERPYIYMQTHASVYTYTYAKHTFM